MFDPAGTDYDPGLDATRLACGGAIEAPSARHPDRLHAWMMRGLYALLAAGVLAVIYGYVAVTP